MCAQSRRSLGPFLVIIKQLADLRQLLLRRLARRQSPHDQALGGATEGALQQVAGELALGPFHGAAGLIEVSSIVLIPLDDALFGHDLERLKYSRILRRLAAGGLAGC